MPEVVITVRSVDDTGGVLDKLNASAGQVQERVGAVAQTNSAVAESSNNAAAATSNATAQMENMAEGAGVAAAATKAVGESADTATASVAGLNGSVMDMGRSLKTMATFMVPMVIAGGFVKAEKSALDFNAAMNQVGTLVHGNQQLMQQWGDQIIKMAPELGQTPTELAKGLYEVLSVNTPVNEAMQMLADSSKAATAGQADLFSTVQLLGGAMHAYGKSVSDVTGISDTLFEGIRTGSVRLPELAQGLGEVLPYSAQLGVSLKDVTAAIVTLTNAGYQPAIAMTGLKELFVDLINQEKKFQAANIDIVADAKSGGITQVIKDLQTVTGGSIEKMKEFVPNIRALGPALTLAGSNAGAFNKHLQDMQKSAGETQTAFEQMMQGSSGAMKQFESESGVMAAQIGKNFDPTVVLAFGEDVEKALTLGLQGLEWFGTEIGKGMEEFTHSALVAHQALLNLLHDVEDLPEAVLHFFGTGSDKKPIMDKISEINSAISGMGGETDYTVNFTGTGSSQLPIMDKLGQITGGLASLNGSADYNVNFTGSGAGSSGAGISSSIEDLFKLEEQYKDTADTLSTYSTGVAASQQEQQYNQMAGQISSLINNYANAPGSSGGGGVTIQVSGITVNGAGNINSNSDLANELETSIAQNIQRNSSPIITALKQAGVQIK